MKKFQLQIIIEQKESWRISRIENAEIPDGATNAETASPFLGETMKDCAAVPPVYRRTRFFRSFSKLLNQFTENFRLFVRKKKQQPDAALKNLRSKK